MAVANPLSISKQPFFGRLFAHSVEFKATVMWLTGTALLVIGLVVFANSFAAEGEVEDWFDPAAVPPIVFEYGICRPSRSCSRFSKKTDQIPARKGTRFGVRFGVENRTVIPNVLIKEMWTHPPLENPKTGEVITETIDEWAWVDTFTGSVFVASITIDRKWKAVPGEWTIELYLIGKYTKGRPVEKWPYQVRILEKTFFVYEPKAGK